VMGDGVVGASLKAELGKLSPPPSDAEFFEERQKLNAAIFDFEFSAPLGMN
jgi:hypothetical protein